jgi:Ni2+-binding GTPase involved in maturation of urease and hydrogenase
VAVGLSKDMCPDHYAIYNFDEMLEWAKAQGADIMLNETAGLCLRCAPYPDKALAICVIDVTTGPNSPLKVGPLLTTADAAVMTKGDLVSRRRERSSGRAFWRPIRDAGSSRPTGSRARARGSWRN